MIYDTKDGWIVARGNVVVEKTPGAVQSVASITVRMENGQTIPVP